MEGQPLTNSLRETLAVFDGELRPWTTTEVAEELGLGRRSTYDRLDRLATQDRLETKKVGANARVWWRPSNDETRRSNNKSEETGGSSNKSEEKGRSSGDERLPAETSIAGSLDESMLKSIFDSQRDIIYAFDTGGKLIRYNERVTEVFGYSETELAALELTDFVPEEAKGGLLDAFERVIRDRESLATELLFETKSGDVIPYEVTGSPITGGDGNVVGLTGVGRDVSSRKAREKQLKRQHAEISEELDDIFSRINDAVYAVDDEFRFTYLNHEAKQLLEQPAETLLGKTVWEIFPEATETDAWDAFHTARCDQEVTSFEGYYEPLGFWVAATVYPSETGLSVYFRDVTEQKEREAELERYEQLIETVDDGIYTATEDGVFTFANSELASMLGTTTTALIGSHISDIVGDELAEVGAEIQQQLQSERELRTVEVTLPDGAGGSFDAETTIGLLPRPDGTQRVGVIRDMTEQKKRERALERQIQAQERIAELGQYALEESDLDAVMTSAAELVAETLETDYCKVLDLSPEDEELLLRQGVGWQEGITGAATVSSVEDDSQAAYTLGTEQPVVVENLERESRFSGPELLTSHDVQSGISVIIGSIDNPWGILGTHDTAVRQFTDRDVNFVQSIANILATAINRTTSERELRRQREELAALVSINEAVQRTTGVAIEQSTREEIEQTVCECLSESDSYLFSWIGEVATGTQRVVPTAHANTGDYLDEIEVAVDPDDERSEGPTGKAFRTGEAQFVRNIQRESGYEPWRETADKRGVRSSAAIPITHGDAVYAVLNMYSERLYAFGTRERSVVSQLGEIIGHAIAASERKRALMSDELVELEFHISNIFDELDLQAPTTGAIAFDEIVPVGEERYLLYGTVTPDARESIEAMARARPYWTALSVTAGSDHHRFEVMLTDPPVLSELASLGGSIAEAFIEDGNYQLTIQLSPSTDTDQFIDRVLDVYPTAEMVARRQIDRTDTQPATTLGVLDDELTDRQSATLRAAYHAGYYEWPRRTTAASLSESLAIAPNTFSQHLRKAEKKVFDGLFADAERVT